MAIQFPIRVCPSCQHDEFHNNLKLQGVSQVTYNNKGEPIKSSVKSMHYSDMRDTWNCANCERAVFTTRDISHV